MDPSTAERIVVVECDVGERVVKDQRDSPTIVLGAVVEKNSVGHRGTDGAQRTSISTCGVVGKHCIGQRGVDQLRSTAEGIT